MSTVITYIHDNKEKQILEKLEYMSSNRKEFWEEKPHYFLNVKFPKEKPVIVFRLGRGAASYWDFSFDELNLKVSHRSSLESILTYVLFLIIDLIILFLATRTQIIRGLILVTSIILCELIPVVLMRRFEKKRVRIFCEHYLKEFGVREV